MLTPREFEIYMMIVTQAMGREKIAGCLGISYATVHRHITVIMEKMGMGTTLELLSQFWRRELGA